MENANATAVIWQPLLIAKKTFRRLDAPESLPDVASGVVYVNGVRVVNQREKKVDPYDTLLRMILTMINHCFSRCARVSCASASVQS